MGQFIDLTGQKFNRLTVLHRDPNSKHGKPIQWICNCDCGTMNISVRGSNLKNGQTMSCGCYNKEVITKHKKIKTPEYNIWGHIIGRCNNPNHPKYEIYGKRGIVVCDRWRNSFEMFLKDMGQRPSNKHSIDRINNDGNYEPSNCKWSTPKEQARNRSNAAIKNLEEANYIRELYKKGYTQKDIADKYKCSMSTISRIIRNEAWID